MTDYKKLCAELAQQLDDALDFTVSGETRRYMKELVGRARAALAEPEPERLTVQEINDLPQHGENYIYSGKGWDDEIHLDGYFSRADLQQLANSVPTSRSN